jgi:hypothetical protein
LVPIELGSRYTDEDWRQKLMTFHEYLVKYVFPSKYKDNGNKNGEKVYYLYLEFCLKNSTNFFPDWISGSASITRPSSRIT